MAQGPNRIVLKILEDEIDQAASRRASEYYIISLKRVCCKLICKIFGIRTASSVF